MLSSHAKLPVDTRDRPADVKVIQSPVTTSPFQRFITHLENDHFVSLVVVVYGHPENHQEHNKDDKDDPDDDIQVPSRALVTWAGKGG